jgi:hypothetical protein
MVGHPPRWRSGTEDIVPLVAWGVPMFIWSLLTDGGGLVDPTVVAAAFGGGLLLKHLLPDRWIDVALLAPVAALLFEAATLSVTIAGLLLAAAASVGLLVWAGVEPGTGLPVARQFEPALIPALALSVAIAVMFFLPSGSGGQVGLAALALLGVLALVAWLYLRAAEDAGLSEPTS